MDNIRQILQQIDQLSFRDKMRLTTRLLEDYLREIPAKTEFDRMDAYQADEMLPLESTIQNMINQSNEKLVEEGRISSGYPKLDKFTNGFPNGSLTIVGSRMNKRTEFSLNIVRNILNSGHAVGFVTADFTPDRLARQMLQLYSGVTMFKPLKEDDSEKLHLAKSTIEELPFHFKTFNRHFPLIQEVLQVCHKMVTSNNIKALFIDPLQQIQSGLTEIPESMEFESDYILTELKKFAREYEIPVILTSALSREADKRSGDKRPVLSDIRGTNIVEEIADNILLLNKPSAYGLIEDEEGNDLKDLTEVIVAKSMNGNTGRVYYRYQADSMIQEEDIVKTID